MVVSILTGGSPESGWPPVIFVGKVLNARSYATSALTSKHSIKVCLLLLMYLTSLARRLAQ